MSTRIIDKKEGRTETGHADGIQSRTLEILESFGILDPILKQGIHDVDMSHWAILSDAADTGQRSGKDSRFGQVLLNQGAVEQAFIEHLDKKDIHVEWHREAESLHFSPDAGGDTQHFPVNVGVKADGSNAYGLEEVETIHARYLIACDGAHGWVGSQLDVQSDVASEESTWGVLDIIPITNFPDIRHSCSINSQPHGSVMTLPRENRLVRLYIQLREDLDEKALQHHTSSPRAMVETAEQLMKPYNLTYKYCDWWSNYSIGRRLVKNFRPHERVFLTGDAAHTHSPKGGQGMNVSIQDSYNLLWKIGAVIANGADPIILETYETERRPVAEQLMELDSQLVHAYEKEQKDTSSGIYEVRDQHAGFMAGVGVVYAHSVLIAQERNSKPARNLQLGMRLPSVLVVNQCDGIALQMGERLMSDGSWRLLVFPGDLRQPERMESLAYFTDSLSKCLRPVSLQRKQDPEWRCPLVELLLIQSSPRSAVNMLDLPELFHPFDDIKGWDYWKVFTDDREQAYTGYGIDEGGPGCLVLCRPDQHIAWIGSMGDTAGLRKYFSAIFEMPT
ncbi:hypothetical protein MW887_008811 [Aspergillus wentii]|nr:hypothetical protein MW887_008811 [Aspergillus wentii]